MVIDFDSFDFSLLARYRSVMVIGRTDTGKTTFVKAALNSLVELTGKRVVIVDLDVGQSDIGHPGTVAFGSTSCKVDTLFDVIPEYFWFYGFFSPGVDLPGYILGLYKLKRRLLEYLSKEDHLLIDTTGWITGYVALSLKLLKIKLFTPKLVVLLGKDAFKLREFISSMGIDSVMINPSANVVVKSFRERALNRYKAVERNFSGKPIVKFSKFKYALIGKGYDLTGRIVGFMDRSMETLVSGWVVKEEDGEVYAKFIKQFDGSISFLKVGEKVEVVE